MEESEVESGSNVKKVVVQVKRKEFVMKKKIEEFVVKKKIEEFEVFRANKMVKRSSLNKGILFTELPLLFAKGKPQNLDTMSQSDLEEFLPFMILCSMQMNLNSSLNDLNLRAAPEWWPEGVPFEFPMIEKTLWINIADYPPEFFMKEVGQRHVMLKSLVCRCYTFYGCEYLLKFSGELAEIPDLMYELDEDKHFVHIRNNEGTILVRCRFVNIHYDDFKNVRQYPSDAPRPTSSQSTYVPPLIDLTCDSEDEKEVNFKEPVPESSNETKKKRKSNFYQIGEKKIRLFDDLPEENPEPENVSQEYFMVKLCMVPLKENLEGEEKEEVGTKPRRKRTLINAFTHIALTTTRAQRLLQENRHTFSLDTSLRRIDKYTTSTVVEDIECNAISTRASTSLNKTFLDNTSTEEQTREGNSEEGGADWVHTFKWPRRARRAHYSYRGPSLKPCSVRLPKLSLEDISYWGRRKSVGTSIPEGLWETLVCSCQKIPIITLDDEGSSQITTITLDDVEDDSSSQYINKSTSTTCASCDISLSMTQEIEPSHEVQNQEPFHEIQNQEPFHEIQNQEPFHEIQNQEPFHEIQNQEPSHEIQNQEPSHEIQNQEPSHEIQNQEPSHEIQNQEPSHEIQNQEPSHEIQNQTNHQTHQKQSIPAAFVSTQKVHENNEKGTWEQTLSFFSADFMEGRDPDQYKTSLFEGVSIECIRVVFERKPLAVVSPSTVSVAKEIQNVTMDQPLPLLPQYQSAPTTKVNVSRSILDAVKWYTKDDHTFDAADTSDNQSQENMMPIFEPILQNSRKPVNYFNKHVNHCERDYCFERSSYRMVTLISRRGGRRYTNREPCASCVDGNDHFCVYEFIRQAKLAGVILEYNQKPLETTFLKFVQAENK